MIFTTEFMKENCGCYSEPQLMNCSFMKLPEITLKSIFESEIPVKDKYWFFCKKVATKEQNQKIAIDLAEMVLPVWEAKYPEDKRPHEAIEAAKLYVAGHITIEQLIEKRRAAYAAAYAAADAGAAYAAAAATATAADDAAAYAAAYAAADAATYADAAAYAYADAYAYAAAAAATAADAAYAAYADAIKKQIQDYLFTLLP